MRPSCTNLPPYYFQINNPNTHKTFIFADIGTYVLTNKEHIDSVSAESFMFGLITGIGTVFCAILCAKN